MRAIVLAVAVLLPATPAFAQMNPALTMSIERSNELQSQLDMQRQQLNAQQNENFAAQTRLRTEQTLRELEAQRPPLHVTPMPAPSATPSKPGPGYAEIPNSALADSNAKVRAASH